MLFGRKSKVLIVKIGVSYSMIYFFRIEIGIRLVTSLVKSLGTALNTVLVSIECYRISF